MKNTDFLNGIFIAHRGLFDNDKIPENSIISFKRALNKNIPIELDVHLTKDNKVVVFHDNNLKRICGVNKIIEDCTYNELLKYNLFNTNYKIPLLKEVLNLINGKVFLLIETKVIKFNGKLENEISELLDDYKGLFAIQSFNVFSIYWFKKNRNGYLRGLLSGDFKNWNINSLKKLIGKSLLIDIFLKTDFISYDIRSIPNFFISSKKGKKPILGWTIKNKKEYLEKKKYLNGFIFENDFVFKGDIIN